MTPKRAPRYRLCMAEVYSIAGAHPGFGYYLGADGPCGPGFAVTPNGNCGAPMGTCPPGMSIKGACRSPLAIDLQNALVALGRAVRDGELVALAVDGFIGPKTVAAVNRAFTKHIGPGQAPAALRTGGLSLLAVTTNAAQLAQLAKGETGRRGAVTPPPPPVATMPAPKPAVTPGVDTRPEIDSSVSSRAVALAGFDVLLLGLGLFLEFRKPGTSSTRRSSRTRTRTRVATASY